MPSFGLGIYTNGDEVVTIFWSQVIQKNKQFNFVGLGSEVNQSINLKIT